jgi:hypothetical protein
VFVEFRLEHGPDAADVEAVEVDAGPVAPTGC